MDVLPAEGNLGKQEKIKTPKMDSRVAASLTCSLAKERRDREPRFPHTDCAIKSVTVVESAVHFTGAQQPERRAAGPPLPLPRTLRGTSRALHRCCYLEDSDCCVRMQDSSRWVEDELE
ncbi:hypothetical protein APTSU1_001433700 [Apodemus speciosus]|uniref:Uncharacterized protein n=1 Tax=Apodemus speciosus TaxID=105296 RepID=A0ABQ0FIT3_APOSI